MIALSAGFLWSISAQAATEAPGGLWLREDGVARVSLAPCGPSLCMTNVWISPLSRSEKVGEYIRLDLKPAGAGKWIGTGHDPQRNLTFSTEMEITGSRMLTSGCMVGGLICKSAGWTRVQP